MLERQSKQSKSGRTKQSLREATSEYNTSLLTSQTNTSLPQSQPGTSNPLGCNTCPSQPQNSADSHHLLQLQDLVDIKIKVDLPSHHSRNHSGSESGDSADASAACDEMVKFLGRDRSENYYVFSNNNSIKDKDSHREPRPAPSKVSWAEPQAAVVQHVLENNIRKQQLSRGSFEAAR